MRRCIAKLRPDCFIHLGDHYDDAQVIAEEYPQLLCHQVPGNCDRYRCPPGTAEILCYPVCGVKMYLTHGHLHFVKSGIGGLLADARRCDAKIALYGHTHRADCHQELDGLWVMNPGACGYGGSVGIIEIRNKEIVSCRILTETDLEESL